MDIRESITELDSYKSNNLTDLTELRHMFMMVYGWIPEDEFYNKSSIDEILKLSNCISLDENRKRDEMDKLKKRSKT